MPVLQQTTNSISEVHLKEFARLGEEIDMSVRRLAIGIIPVQSITLPILQINAAVERIVEPIRIAQDAMAQMFLPIKIIQDSMNTSMLPMMKAMDAYAETHRRMMESVSLLGLKNINQVGLGLIPRNSISDGEIVEEKNNHPLALTQQVAIIPQQQALVPTTPNTPGYQTRAIMGLKEISGRSFQFKRKTLQKLSHRNCEGRLLSLFLANRDLFVSDEDIRDKLHISEGRSFSWVLRNLKRKLRSNGLSAIIERRWSPDGYILIDIHYNN